MFNDPIVEEMRTHGMNFAARHGNDIGRMCAALREKERSQGRKVVRRESKRMESKTKPAKGSDHLP